MSALSAEEGLLLMREKAPLFYKCPRGHKLPHRMTRKGAFGGRCSPSACIDFDEFGTQTSKAAGLTAVDLKKKDLAPYYAEMDMLPRGAEAEVFKKAEPSDALEAYRGQEQARESMRLMKVVAATFAREGIHNFPEIPAPAAGIKDAQEYAERRLKDVLPYALEQMIYTLRFGESEKSRNWAAAKLAAMAGFSESKELAPSTNGPVVIIQNPSLPYEKQLNRDVESSAREPKELPFSVKASNAKK